MPVRAIRRMAYWALGWVGKPGYSSLDQDYGWVSFLNPAYRAVFLTPGPSFNCAIGSQMERPIMRLWFAVPRAKPAQS